MAAISLKVNGYVHAVDVDPGTPLLYVLSDDLQLRGPKFGCGFAQCRACTVPIRGQAVRSCVMPVSAVRQQEVTTLEGLGTPETPHAIQQAFIDEGAAQCGFCLSAKWYDRAVERPETTHMSAHGVTKIKDPAGRPVLLQ